MKKIICTILLLTPFVLLNAQTKSPDYGLEFSVLINAEADITAPAIRLSWTSDQKATSYAIYRKMQDSTTWGSVMATVQAPDTTYIDSSIKKGLTYEYFIGKINSGNYIFGTGYIFAGIDIPAIESRGRVLVLVDSSMSDSLVPELDIFKRDLQGDGWIPDFITVSPKDTVPNIMNLVRNEHAKDSITMLILLGNVPVPYSGNQAFDGHTASYPPSHRGAWPADIIYGVTNGTWTDFSVDLTEAAWEENKNVPSDGKYDQWSYLQINADVNIQVGRIDLSGMPAFKASAIQLTKNYLKKDHDYKHGEILFRAQAMVEDKFNTSSEGFNQSGWRNFGAFFGSDSVFNGDVFASTKNENYQWIYKAAGGRSDFTGFLKDDGNTQDFVADSFQFIYAMLFGSYFGDWDKENNFMKAPLASRGPALATIWAGRPNYFLHSMGMGENIGKGLIVSQKNYKLSASQPATYNYTGYYATGIHMAMMGDPSLRLHVVKPVSQFAGDTIGNGHVVKLTWNHSPDSILGYYIYRLDSAGRNFIRLNKNLFPTTNYIDSHPDQKTHIYMVRAVKRQITNGGTYFNLSQGKFDTVTGINLNMVSLSRQPDFFNIYPNPTRGKFYIRTTGIENYRINLFTPQGKIVYTEDVNSGLAEKEIDISGLSKGVYIISVKSGNETAYKKLLLK